jgi:hypothetical protein
VRGADEGETFNRRRISQARAVYGRAGVDVLTRKEARLNRPSPLLSLKTRANKMESNHHALIKAQWPTVIDNGGLSAAILRERLRTGCHGARMNACRIARVD